MRKKLAAALGFVCTLVLAAGIASCGGSDLVTYTLDSANFDKVIVYNGAVDYSGLVIESSDGKEIAVTQNMVSGADTSSVGAKQFTVSYEGTTMTVDYTVKYAVNFSVNNQTVNTQLVLNANEIEVPSAYQSYEWTPAIPATITDNMTFVGSEPAGGVEVAIEIGDNANELPVGAAGVSLPVLVTGTNKWEATVSNDNVSIKKMNGMVLVSANKAGVTTLTVSAGGKEESKTIVVKPNTMSITEGAKTYGIENVYTIGRTDVNGGVMTKALTVSCDNVGEGFTENLVWNSSSAKASVENGVITLVAGTGAELVTFTADFFGKSVSFTARCVYDGVNVSSYADLYAATKAQKTIILGADIAFPTNVNEIKYETVHTTYDDTFYKNAGIQDKATIKVLLQFKNDLYGNGYEINAHNATVGLVATGNPLFKGPLNFVALTPSASSQASVKGQDNVCFGVYEGVTINNVTLKAANLENDLTELNYAGTTVEVFGDDVTIEYSRIMNGRTVLRVFGDATDSGKVIHVDVKNCVLSGAREFILRMGSNAFVQGTDGNVSPYLGEERDLIGIKSGKVAKSADYEEKYIKTYVNVSNSVFKDAGIFAVGIDTHFAGEALHKGHPALANFEAKEYWRNLAKTSYGAKLTFNGEVKMYNWKKIEDIDSSTLIEMDTSMLSEEIVKMLTFDVGAMIGAISKEEGYKTIVTEDGYVHAGIAFFGGGHNYGLFEDNANTRLEGFEVSLEAVGKGSLAQAAGNENFYFNIYDTTTGMLTPEMQNNMSEEEMYACINKK